MTEFLLDLLTGIGLRSPHSLKPPQNSKPGLLISQVLTSQPHTSGGSPGFFSINPALIRMRDRRRGLSHRYARISYRLPELRIFRSLQRRKMTKELGLDQR